ncbi:MAG TPA: MMPL family transporter [Solirubrobacterales bacterium]|nr:MMPL family transporter [Solirubrobacterales bacterium]
MAAFLYRLGLGAARRRWLVLGAWLVALVVIGFAVRTLGAETSNNLDLPGTDSQAATDLLTEKFPPQQNGANPLVFNTSDGKVTDDRYEQAIKESRSKLLELSYVDTAPSPYSQKGASQISDDKGTAFIPVLLNIANADITEEKAQRVLDAGEPARSAGMKVEAGGQVGSDLSQPATESSEVIGLLAATIILAFTFGTMVAMGLPIASAVFGLLIGLSLIGLLGHLAPVPDIAPTLATMIGLGVGIDYALFLVTRYRSELDSGKPTEEAVATAVATSGSAIVFAGSTVVLALVTLLLAGIPLVTSLGYASAIAVVTAVAAALTLLPAILAAIGPRIDHLRLPWVTRPGAAAPAAAAGAAVPAGIWGRWATFVTDRPGRAVLLSLLILLPPLIPFFALNLGQEDIGATPKSTTERQAYDLIASGFGPGYNGPLLVAVELGTPAKPSPTFLSQKSQAEDLQAELEQEQASGQAEADFLSQQAEGLSETQTQLEGEGAALEAQESDLEAEGSRLQSERARLTRERTLRAQLDALAIQVREVATEGARLAAEEAALRARRSAIISQERRVKAKLAGQLSPTRRAELERRLARLQSREATVDDQIAAVSAERAANRGEAEALARQAAELRAEAAALGGSAVSLGEQALGLATQAIGLAEQKEQLEQAATEAEVAAANLRADKAELEAEKMVAEVQAQEAQQLQQELTKELTAAGGDERGTDQRLVDLQNGLKKSEGVDVVSPPQINDSGDAALFNVIATTDPALPATADLVRAIRVFVIPSRTDGDDVTAHVGGSTAANVDLADGISARLPLVILAVIMLGFLVLMMAFRSILIPAQAALINALAVCAAFGIVVACFQWGWGLGLVGVETDSGTDPIASFVPLIMFAVLFGLSMDYQVFLLSQIEQHRAGAATEKEAIAAGLATGARVIGAAALIMIAVFASFILNGDPTVKQFGVGLAVGVALAAMSVLLLAPAFLVLVGRGIRWLPDWAERRLPQIDIEGAGQAEEAAEDA